MITQKKWLQLRQRMLTLGLDETDISEQFIAGSGKGGQKINKSATCVRLSHEPTGIQLKCQKSRSRSDNRFFARRLLCDRFEAEFLGEKSVRDVKQQGIRKQKKRRQARSRANCNKSSVDDEL